MSLAVTASSGWSVYALLFGGAGMSGMRMPFPFTFGAVNGQNLYFEEAAGVTTAVIVGRYLEARAKHRAASALTALAALGVKSVAELRDGGEQRVPAAELAAGDLFVVRPGSGSPPMAWWPRAARPSTPRSSLASPCRSRQARATRDGRHRQHERPACRPRHPRRRGHPARPGHPPGHAGQASKASAQRLADRIAAVFVPCVISLAVATFGFWLGSGLPAPQAWSAVVAVLVVACPCAARPGHPRRAGRRRGPWAELGLLAKSARALEAGRRIRVVVLDKTGTLTAGTMAVTAVVTDPALVPAAGHPGGSADEALLLAGAVEDASEHPVGQAIAREAAARFGGLPPVTRFAALPGAGITGRAGSVTSPWAAPLRSPNCPGTFPPHWRQRSPRPRTAARRLS